MPESNSVDVSAHLDGILLGRIQLRDQSSLAALYDSRSRLVYSIVLGVVRNRDDAEEVTQDVFRRIWEKACSFDPARGNVLVWIVTIARRMAIDRTRSKHHRFDRNSVEVEPEKLHEVTKSGEVAMPEQIAVRMLVSSALKRLEGLSSDHREVIELAYYGGLSHSEIAEQISAPLGTVKSRLRAAISNLRVIMGTEV